LLVHRRINDAFVRRIDCVPWAAGSSPIVETGVATVPNVVTVHPPVPAKKHGRN
jgi:hypothetical protein